MCETKPIWLVGRSPGEGNTQNKPNLPPAMLGPAGPITRNKANCPRKLSGEDAQPTKSREAIVRNKVNLARAGWGPGPIVQKNQFLPRCRSGDRRSRGTNVRNKANFAAGEICHYSTIPSFQYSSPISVVRNKANWRPSSQATAWDPPLWGRCAPGDGATCGLNPGAPSHRAC